MAKLNYEKQDVILITEGTKFKRHPMLDELEYSVMQNGPKGREKRRVKTMGRRCNKIRSGIFRACGLKVTFSQRLSPVSPALERTEGVLKMSKKPLIAFSLNDSMLAAPV